MAQSSSTPTPRAAGIPGWLLAIAVTLPVALVVGVLVVAAQIRSRPQDPVRLAGVPAPTADSADCTRLLAALPEKLDGGEHGPLTRRRLAIPAPVGAAAWGEPPVVLRCGLDRPDDLTATSRLLAISDVQFLELPDPGTNTWVAVDRPVYIVVDLPPVGGSGPLQQVATVIANTLAQRDVDVSR
ncbi:MAG TPA: DUF3515 domain-containing protein [Pseudonocardiaceae bacterium]|nr:DUF3515 domain-containing protein [Pseudonocardiaceae bacterium]